MHPGTSPSALPENTPETPNPKAEIYSSKEGFTLYSTDDWTGEQNVTELTRAEALALVEQLLNGLQVV